MNLLELFDSRDKKKRLSHIRNLVALACSDGTLEKSEMDLIFQIGIKSGLTQDELRRIFVRPESIGFHPPESFRERIEQLYDMVMVMMVNGELHQNEIALCKITALKLGFKTGIIDKMVHDTIDLIARGIAADIALSRLMDLVED
ncbi:MAG: TerB family tellurite resistance protein [Patescibacteria group bacterium]|nr:TerB family tellurite resistance protein [Patescibacteria group bacterium]